MPKRPALLNYHECLDIVCSAFGVPGSHDLHGAIKWIKESWRPRPPGEAADEILQRLRNGGWTVAVHNDYFQGGTTMTFWLLIHPDGQYAKGRGQTDHEALLNIATHLKEQML